MRVLVVGGGVAGLTCAAALGQRGFSAEVVEIGRVDEGTGLGIRNGGITALEAVGVLPDIIAAGAAYDRPPGFFDRSGTPIPRPEAPERPDGLPSYLKVFRPYLNEVLARRVQNTGGTIRRSVTVDDLQQFPKYVDVSFTDGTRGTYDLVVGADGLRSDIRRRVIAPEARPQRTGALSIRWIPEGVPQRMDSAGVYYADDVELVVLPMHGDRTYLNVQHDDDDQRLERSEAIALLRAKLDRFTAPYVVDIRSRLTDEAVPFIRRYESLFVERWHNGRTVIIGDAAHTTTAHLGSGAVIALEDAVVLAEELSAPGSIDEQLERFSRRRVPRCRMVVDTSVRLSELQRRGANSSELMAIRGPALEELARAY